MARELSCRPAAAASAVLLLVLYGLCGCRELTTLSGDLVDRRQPKMFLINLKKKTNRK
jgi:hypothetical protein